MKTKEDSCFICGTKMYGLTPIFRRWPGSRRGSTVLICMHCRALGEETKVIHYSYNLYGYIKDKAAYYLKVIIRQRFK